MEEENQKMDLSVCQKEQGSQVTSHKQKREKVWAQICVHPFFEILCFMGVTFFQFAILEIFFQVNVMEYSWEIIGKNLLLIAAGNLFVVGIFHGIFPSLLLTSVFYMVVGIANYFVISFRGYGIVFMDLYAIKTAATVMGHYTYGITKIFVAAVAANIALIGVTFLLPGRKHSYRSRKYTLLSLAGMAVSGLFVLWINVDVVFFQDVSTLTWDHNIGMKEYGYVLYFASNAGKATVEKPEGYSAQKADEILSRYTQKTQSVGKTTPNLIMIMNESFSNLNVLGDLETNQPVMPFYESLTKNTVKGYAESSVYGGYTANSEFEFLTGCTKAFLEGNPYLQYIDGKLPSLITSLKKSRAYSKVTAMHPYNASGYNRNRVYPLLGFDRFLSIEDFSKKNLVRDYVGDEKDYEKIQELYEKKKKGEPLCVFNVTMQNHNPYDDKTYSFKDPVKVTNMSVPSSVEQYLSLMKMSDNGLKKLVEYFEKVKEPTIILIFGDHQPHLPDVFYKNLMGTFPNLFTKEQVMKQHKIPFMIWANYPIKERNIPCTSLNYLSSILLETAKLPMSDYNRYLLELAKTLPSISASGYYDKKGVLHTYSSLDNTHEELLREYEIVQYNYLFDHKNRLKHHFEASKASRTAMAN